MMHRVFLVFLLFGLVACGDATGPESALGTYTLKMIKGQESEDNYDLLVELCDTMEDASLCAMGGMTPYPVRSVLKYFAEDFK